MFLQSSYVYLSQPCTCCISGCLHPRPSLIQSIALCRLQNCAPAEFAREALIRSVFLHIAHITAAFFPLWTSLSPRRQAMNRSSDVDMFISRLSRTCHATFVLAVIASCASDPRSAIRGQRMATTESPPVVNVRFNDL